MSAFQIFCVFLKLGCTSFGGPVAHIGFFHQCFVQRYQLLSDKEFSQLVALCQFIPGPASSQLGMAIGMRLAGQTGCFAAWLGFTLPSAGLMCAFVAGIDIANTLVTGLVDGLLLVAVIVVAQAVRTMYKSLCQHNLSKAIAIVSALLLLFLSLPLLHIGVLLLAALVSVIVTPIAPPSAISTATPLSTRYLSKGLGAVGLATFVLVLLISPYLTQITTNHYMHLFDITYRGGALVFGGGHVVLPMLQADVVASGLQSQQAFLTGYGFAQALPGPLFTFATYIGAATSENLWLGAMIATIGIFLPGYLVLLGGLSMLTTLNQSLILNKALAGINGAVVGILFATFVDPVLSKAINTLEDIVIVLAGSVLLMVFKQHLLIVMALVLTANTAINGLF